MYRHIEVGIAVMAGIDRKVKERQRQNRQAEKRAAKAAKKQERKAGRERPSR